jgi:hypothetical protein
MLAALVAAALQTIAVAVPARPVIEIDGLAGDVTVEAGQGGEVAVSAVAEGQGWSASATSTPAGAHVVARCGPSGASVARCGPGHVHLAVRVPADSELRVSSIRGALTIRGVRGPLTIDSVAGPVSIETADAEPPAGLLVSAWRATGRMLVRTLAALLR